MKKCSKCEIEKELNEFHKAKRNKDGLQHICKSCAAIEHKEWYENNKEVAKESAKEWREKNKEHIKEWYENNKERVKESAKEWRINNREYNKEWYKNNKERVDNKRRTTEGKYKSLKNSAKTRDIEMQISFKQYVEIIKDNKCYYCDTTLADSFGSSLNRVDNNKGYLVSNVKPCCSTCNYIMLDFDIEDLESRVYKIVNRMKKAKKENGVNRMKKLQEESK